MSSNKLTSTAFAPGSWLGVLGGGQLSRFFCHAAQNLGFKVAVLDPSAASPAGAVADKHLCAAYDDPQALQQLAQLCLAVTTEFENVPADSFRYLEKHTRVSPGPQAIAYAQDRLQEKNFLSQQAGVDVAPYCAVLSEQCLSQAPHNLFPGVLKAARLGYDGKGQLRVASRAEAVKAWRHLGEVDCVLEAFLPLQSEISVVLGRSLDGDIRVFTPAENAHHDGILLVSRVQPGNETSPSGAVAIKEASRIAQALDYVGVMCVEFFELSDGRLIVNEIAPRPHNSGHYTLDGCLVSQFDLQARLMAGLPHGSLQALQPTIMINLLGDLWFDDKGQLIQPNFQAALNIPGSQLYLYGKTQARPGRKMGHINLVAESAALVEQQAKQVAQILGIQAQECLF